MDDDDIIKENSDESDTEDILPTDTQMSEQASEQLTDDVVEMDMIEGVRKKVEIKEPTPVPKNMRSTINVPLTNYEKTRIIGLRVEQLKSGAHPMLDFDDNTDAFKIAEIELSKNLLPFIIRRKMPNNTYEDFGLDELAKNL